MSDVWAAVPVKEFTGAKQRLSGALSPDQRETLAATMLEDVLDALSQATRLAGILVNTVDPCAAALAQRYGARVVAEDARGGHTGAVLGMAKVLLAEGKGALLTVPGDIPAVTAWEVDTVVSSCLPAPSFTIVPAHDELGSNAVLCCPPAVVPLRFGDNSFFPHLATARRHGIAPTVVRLRGIGMDIDHAVDLRMFMRMPEAQRTRTRVLLDRFGL
ncbi:MAG: 2-phospho-L-lactate guanylyltransferase [Acetobacteraceae bacterium]